MTLTVIPFFFRKRLKTQKSQSFGNDLRWFFPTKSTLALIVGTGASPRTAPGQLPPIIQWMLRCAESFATPGPVSWWAYELSGTLRRYRLSPAMLRIPQCKRWWLGKTWGWKCNISMVDVAYLAIDCHRLAPLPAKGWSLLADFAGHLTI